MATEKQKKQIEYLFGPRTYPEDKERVTEARFCVYELKKYKVNLERALLLVKQPHEWHRLPRIFDYILTKPTAKSTQFKDAADTIIQKFKIRTQPDSFQEVVKSLDELIRLSFLLQYAEVEQANKQERSTTPTRDSSARERTRCVRIFAKTVRFE